jgi:hypothetical protein
MFQGTEAEPRHRGAGLGARQGKASGPSSDATDVIAFDEPCLRERVLSVITAAGSRRLTEKAAAAARPSILASRRLLALVAAANDAGAPVAGKEVWPS